MIILKWKDLKGLGYDGVNWIKVTQEGTSGGLWVP
jgi:hypothetical protein